MSSFKEPSFQERQARAAEAKNRALNKLRAKPPVDEAVLAERRAAATAREAAREVLRQEKLEADRIAREARAAAKEAAVQMAATADPEMTDAEKKEARDARYAARKQRVGKR